MEKIINLAKNRGFIYPGSLIYGGLSNSWDYGPLGSLLKSNIKKAWEKKFVQESPYNVLIDSAIIMNRKTWEASGHLSSFSDPLIDCKECKQRFRADELIENYLKENGALEETLEKVGSLDALSDEELSNLISKNSIPCPNCGNNNFTPIRKFNLMFKTFQGVTEDQKNELFLRPETAQGIFVNFKNVLRTSRKKLPFGIAQVGKSFRNEITPGNFIFRTREFEQMELEFFCEPKEEEKWFSYWKNFSMEFLYSLNVKKELLKFKDHKKEELSHYSNATTDIIFKFPFGFSELLGVASRTDFDLKAHSDASGEELVYTDLEKGAKFIPYCIEPSLGVERLLLAILISSYHEEELKDGDTRVNLKLHPFLSPYKASVLPLSKKLLDKALKIYEDLKKDFSVNYDESGSIGKRYRREDEIGTPLAITVDFDTENDNTVTVRDRDTMEQIRVDISKLKEIINEKIKF